MPDIAGFADPVSVYAEYAREVGVPINLWTDENLEIMQSEVVSKNHAINLYRIIKYNRNIKISRSVTSVSSDHAHFYIKI